MCLSKPPPTANYDARFGADKRELGRGFWVYYRVLINGEKREAALISHIEVKIVTPLMQSQFLRKLGDKSFLYTYGLSHTVTGKQKLLFQILE